MNQDQTQAEGIQLRPVQVHTPTKAGAAEITIRRHDWRRIKKDIDELPQPGQWITAIYSIFLGGGLAFLVAWIQANATDKFPAGLRSMYVVIFILCFCFSVGVFFIERYLGKHIKHGCKRIAGEMNDIEKMYRFPNGGS